MIHLLACGLVTCVLKWCERNFFLFIFPIVSNFNMMKTLTLSVHAGLFWCFHSPPHSDVDYRIFNVRMWSCCMRIHSVYSLIWRAFVESAQNLTPKKSQGAAGTKPTHYGHPSRSVDTVLWLCPSLPPETLKWLSSLPTLMQEPFWWWQCSDRYIISHFPHLHNPPPPHPHPIPRP